MFKGDNKMKKIIVMVLTMVAVSAQAADYGLILRGGGGLGFSDLNKSGEKHEDSHMIFGGIKPHVEFDKWDLSLAIDFVKYTINTDLSNHPQYTGAKHINENILFALSPKYKFTEKFQAGPYYGRYLEENIIAVDRSSKDVVGVEADYKFAKNWMVSAGLEHSTDSSSKHRIAKVSIGYNFGFTKPAPVVKPQPKRVCQRQEHIVYFDFDKSKIKEQEKERLDQYLKGTEGMLRVEGHTDKVGTKKYNQGLSERRVKTVVEKLMKMGYKIYEQSAHGEEKPASDKNKENRRVEISDCY